MAHAHTVIVNAMISFKEYAPTSTYVQLLSRPLVDDLVIDQVRQKRSLNS